MRVNKTPKYQLEAKSLRSEDDLVRLVVRIASEASVDAIICATETGALATKVHRRCKQIQVIAATTNAETYDALTKTEIETIRLPIKSIDRYNQIRHMLSVALRSQHVGVGELVLCSLGRRVYPQAKSDMVVLGDVEAGIEYIAVSDLLKLTDGIRPSVMEIAVNVACHIGQITRGGKNIGAIIMLGDSVEVLKGARQLIPNPFQGHDADDRRLTRSGTQHALVELAKLDGAFVIRGDGFIQTAGTFLATFDVEVNIPPGFGARHLAAAAVTKRTAATAIVVSATDGNVRVFSGGKMVLQLDPNVAYDLNVEDP
ncbi:MAG: diadenylate cyclase [Desulfobacterales bacterium]|nr:diadenylate cyclase [Desulfobacterales bacterium]